MNNLSYGYLFICFLLLSFLLVSPGEASTYIPVGDGIYDILSRLEAEGVITTGLLSTRPISRGNALRLLEEAETNAEGRSSLIRELVTELRRRMGASGANDRWSLDSVYAKYVRTNAPQVSRSYPGATRELEQAFAQNNDGDLYARGGNERAGLVFRVEDWGPFSLFLDPEFRISDDREKGIVKRGYGVLGFFWIDIILGRDSMWWGPGYHGALLMSNNAEPLTMMRLTASEPLTLPWVFKYLGPFQYTVFVSRLEKERSDFPGPSFWGMRFDFKPHPNIEIGLERTGILGGHGRPEDAETWLNSILGTREHSGLNPGDQRAGGDVKITLPFTWQPVQIYWERAGEENRQRLTGFPYKFADLYGLYLPSLFGIERIDLRAEYAFDRVRQQRYVWYTHGVYTAGYTYQGMVMGHHMGTDAQDIYAELTCRFPERGGRLSLGYDQMTHFAPQALRETVRELSMRAVMGLSRSIELDIRQGYAWSENAGQVQGAAVRSQTLEGTITYLF